LVVVLPLLPVMATTGPSKRRRSPQASAPSATVVSSTPTTGSAGGVPRGTYEKGVDDFEVLDADGHPDFWDEATATHWTYNGNEFWSYDDERSLGWKADYANGLRPPDGATRPTLRGVLFWELSGDAPDGRLLRSLRESLGTAPAH
jgi:chitinase